VSGFCHHDFPGTTEEDLWQQSRGDDFDYFALNFRRASLIAALRSPDMVEKVARALCVDRGGVPDRLTRLKMRNAEKFMWQLFRNETTTAIAAIIEQVEEV